MKRILKIGLSLILCVSIFACSSKNESNNEEFTTYLDSLPAVLFGNTSTAINQLLDNPEAYGIKVDEYTLDFMSYEDYQEDLQKSKDIKKKLKSFDYDKLSKEQQISYDVLLDYVDLELAKDDNFYYLSTNYFDVNTGVQSSLPLELWIYDFKDKTALDSYLAIMKSTTKMFEQYVNHEKDRQAKGFGMSQTYLNDVIESLQTFNNGDHSYILTSTNEKIDALDFIDDEEKQQYKDAIAQAYENDFLPAYVNAQQQLSAIQSTAAIDASLSDYTDGKDYYEYLIAQNTGFDSIDEYKEFLEDQESIIYKNAMSLGLKYSDLDEDSLSSIQYTKIENIAELLEYLENSVNKDVEFPKLDKLNYSMEVVPEALRTIFQAYAAYYLSAFDNEQANEQMILNGEYSQSDYNTIAHEGFPGHMYQHNYFKTVDHHIIRDLLSNTGYVEGWATYAATQACAYADQVGACEFMEANNDLVYLYILNLDLMIHYNDASRVEVYAYLREKFQINDESQLATQYEQLLESPAVFAAYYGGKYQITNLQDEAKEAWGDEYSDKKFNEAILEFGPMPLNLLNDYMEEEFD